MSTKIFYIKKCIDNKLSRHHIIGQFYRNMSFGCSNIPEYTNDWCYQAHTYFEDCKVDSDHKLVKVRMILEED